MQKSAINLTSDTAARAIWATIPSNAQEFIKCRAFKAVEVNGEIHKELDKGRAFRRTVVYNLLT
jgi:hypothetical protein